MTTTLDVFRNEKDIRSFAPEAVIFHEGERGHEMFAVLDGSVEIRKGDVVLATLGAGSIFGEMALIDDAPRSADAVAKTACRVAVVDERSFLRLIAHNPQIALQLMTILSERLRDTDQAAARHEHRDD